jgi:hypothetical protein
LKQLIGLLTASLQNHHRSPSLLSEVWKELERALTVVVAK